MTLSAQFVGLSASTPEEYAATSITSYYLFQQAGTMIGITVTTVLQHLVFKEKLESTIGESPEDLKVRRSPVVWDIGTNNLVSRKSITS